MDRTSSTPPTFTNPVHEAIFWRGVFIHRYGGVEHSISELLLRAAGRDEYRLFGDLPFPWPKRLTRLQQVIDADGPIAPYAAQLRTALAPFLALERHRNIMVHGMMGLVGDSNPPLMAFRGFEHVGKDVGETSLYLTLDQMRAYADEVQRSSGVLVPLVARIFREVGLEPIETADRVDLPPKRTSI